MLDIQFIREHADVVKESQRKRGESVELVDEVLRSDEVRRSSLKEFEAARAQQKEIGKKVAAAPADEKAKLIAATKELSQKVSEYKAAADAAAEDYTTAMWKLSNIVEPEAPEGGEDDYVVVKKVGQIRDFAAEGFEPKDHLTLGRGVAGLIELAHLQLDVDELVGKQTAIRIVKRGLGLNGARRRVDGVVQRI